MKEGYIQLKISEINDKCKDIEQMIKIEKSKIELLEEKVGGFKELVKKLDNLDKFKDNIIKQIKEENKEQLLNETKDFSKKIEDEVNIIVKTKIKEIEKTITYVSAREKELNKQTEMILQLNEKLTYLLNHNNLLMMKLVNKQVITDREVDEMHIRSSKK